MSTERNTAHTKSQAEQLASTLRSATCTLYAKVFTLDNGCERVEVELTQRTIPSPMLETISEYGPLKVRRVCGPSLRFIVEC